MRAYFQLFFGLLIPLSALFIAAAVFYFQLEYSFTKAMRIGVLSGFFISIAVSSFTALFLLIMRKFKQPQADIFEGVRNKNKKSAKASKKLKIQEPIVPKVVTSQNPVSSSNTQKVMMLLMEKSIAFEVLLYAIAEQNLGMLTGGKESDGHLILKTKEGIIKVLVTPLSKHTSSISLRAETDTQYLDKIVHYVKKKEYAFTQY